MRHAPRVGRHAGMKLRWIDRYLTGVRTALHGGGYGEHGFPWLGLELFGTDYGVYFGVSALSYKLESEEEQDARVPSCEQVYSK